MPLTVPPALRRPALLAVATLAAATLAAPALAQSNPAIEKARAAAVAELVAGGLDRADALYVVACSMGEAPPGGGACDWERIQRLTSGGGAPPSPSSAGSPGAGSPSAGSPSAGPPDAGLPAGAPADTRPPPPPPALDTSTASVSMPGDPVHTYSGHAYVTPIHDGFAVLALASAPLVGGSWAVPDGAPFSMVEVRLTAGLGMGAVAGVPTLYHWGADGAPADGPGYLTEADAVAITAIERDPQTDALVAVEGTIEAAFTVIDGDQTLGVRTLRAAFRALPGQIPPP